MLLEPNTDFGIHAVSSADKSSVAPLASSAVWIFDSPFVESLTHSRSTTVIVYVPALYVPFVLREIHEPTVVGVNTDMPWL